MKLSNAKNILTVVLLFFLLGVLETGCARKQMPSKERFSLPCAIPDISRNVEKVEEPEHVICRSKTPERENTPNVWPVSYYTRISSIFKNRRRGGRTHKGIDMEAPTGTPVLATADGTVAFAGRDGAYGNIIVIDHGNGYETAYGHLKQCLVNKGDDVACEQQVGQVGSTGNATAPHLHYEVRYQGVPTDPAPWLPQWNVVE